MIIVRRAQARDAEMIAALARTAATRRYSVSRFTLAAATARAGSIDETRRVLDELRRARYAIHGSYAWSMAMTELAEAAEVAGDSDAGAHVLHQCSPYAGRIAVAGPCVNRPFDQALAQAALAVDDTVLAEHYARQRR